MNFILPPVLVAGVGINALLIHVLIAAIIFGVLFWLVQQFANMLPPPVPRVIQVILVVIFVIWLIELLLPLAGGI